MLSERSLFEPAVRVVHDLLLGHRRRGVAVLYEPTFYVFYASIPAVIGVIGIGITLFAVGTHRSTDAKLDAFLNERLPRHEINAGEEARRPD